MQEVLGDFEYFFSTFFTKIYKVFRMACNAKKKTTIGPGRKPMAWPSPQVSEYSGTGHSIFQLSPMTPRTGQYENFPKTAVWHSTGKPNTFLTVWLDPDPDNFDCRN